MLDNYMQWKPDLSPDTRKPTEPLACLVKDLGYLDGLGRFTELNAEELDLVITYHTWEKKLLQYAWNMSTQQMWKTHLAAAHEVIYLGIFQNVKNRHIARTW